MNRHTVIDWFRQRPWLAIPFLGIIPLASLAMLNRPSSSSLPASTPTLSSSSGFSSPGILATPAAPSAAPLLSPSASVSPTSKPTPPPTPTVQRTPNLSPKSVAPPHQALHPGVASAMNLSVDAAIEMHVAIAEGVSSFSVGTTVGGEILEPQKGKRLATLSGGQTYPTQASGNSILLGSLNLPSMVLVVPNAGGLVYVGDRAYRGQMLLYSQGDRLWAVSYISMQQYLYSVVGCEVSPSWPLEALKAQAVAARSYALTYYLKPVSPLYHLGATEYYQVYKGVESEANTTRQAVNATGGEFVSYRGGVVESLYAATDDIVMEAFQGKGMSQIGALNLAEHGYKYHQILGNYYSGTGVGRIETDVE